MSSEFNYACFSNVYLGLFGWVTSHPTKVHFLGDICLHLQLLSCFLVFCCCWMLSADSSHRTWCHLCWLDHHPEHTVLLHSMFQQSFGPIAGQLAPKQMSPRTSATLVSCLLHVSSLSSFTVIHQLMVFQWAGVSLDTCSVSAWLQLPGSKGLIHISPQDNTLYQTHFHVAQAPFCPTLLSSMLLLFWVNKDWNLQHSFSISISIQKLAKWG